MPRLDTTGGAQLKHRTIASVLEREIRAGRVPRGDQLPGEAALAERFSVSRNTVRAALSELGRAGLIATHTGKGSFVTFDSRPLNVRLGWARALEEQGVASSVTVLRLDEVHDAGLAEELGVASDRFIAIDRLRSIVGGPAISLERSRIPATDRVRTVATVERAAGSLTQLLHDAGLVAATGEQWVEVRRLDADDDADAANRLGRTGGDSFLWSRCVTRTIDGSLVECVESLLDPAHFRLHFQFSADN